jgi:hypothetical protein
MIQSFSRPVGAALALGLCLAQAHAANGLSTTNFVDVGDSVSEMLDTSGLAFSTMLMSSAARPPSARAASFGRRGVAGTAASLSRPETFDRTCPGGGSARVDVLDADAGGALSIGDSFKVTFKSCVLDGSAISGRSEFVVAGHRFEGNSEVTELDFRFDALGSSQMHWTGSARAALRTDLQRGTESYVVAYRDLAVTRGPHTMRWSFSVEMVRPPIGNQVAKVDGAMTVDGMALRLRQDEPFVIAGDGHPRSGLVTASDRHGARLEIEAMRRWYAYRLFRAANAGVTPDAASQSKPYGTR